MLGQLAIGPLGKWVRLWQHRRFDGGGFCTKGGCLESVIGGLCCEHVGDLALPPDKEVVGKEHVDPPARIVEREIDAGHLCRFAMGSDGCEVILLQLASRPRKRRCSSNRRFLPPLQSGVGAGINGGGFCGGGSCWVRSYASCEKGACFKGGVIEPIGLCDGCEFLGPCPVGKPDRHRPRRGLFKPRYLPVGIEGGKQVGRPRYLCHSISHTKILLLRHQGPRREDRPVSCFSSS